MKQILYIIILLNFNVIFSQKKAIITYSLMTNEPLMSNSKRMENPSLATIFDEAEDALQRLTFQLHIDEKSSKFWLEKGMAIEGRSNKIATVLADDSEYFRNEKIGYVAKRFTMDEAYFVKYNLIDKWNITQETKTINGFLCFKATSVKIVQGKDHIKEIPVTAWFSPKIPLQFGPKQYGNLPGLILELNEGKITFLVSKIELDSSKLENIIPNIEGEKVYSEIEYSEMVKQKLKKVRENIGL